MKMRKYEIKLRPIGFVRKNSQKDETSKVVLFDEFKEGLEGLKDFSHAFIIFWMHKISEGQRKILKVHPRGKPELPLTGVFATRSPARPNPIGLTLVRILKVEGNILTVKGLDAFDTTPVLDIKPFGRRSFNEEVRVPEWWKRMKNRA